MRNNSVAQSRAVYSKRHSFAAYPLALLAAAFSLGIFTASFFKLSLSVLVSVALAFSLLAIIALLIPRKRGFATILITLAIGSLGASLAAIERVAVPANQLKRLIDQGVIGVGDPVELTGVLEREPEMSPERLYFQLRVEAIRFVCRSPARPCPQTPKVNPESVAAPPQTEEQQVSGVVMLLAAIPSKSIAQEFDRLDLRYGARLRVVTRLERADNFRNPGVSSFTEFLDRKGYDATGFVKSALLIERLENERVFLPLAWVYDWRRRLQNEIDARFSVETAAVLDASMLGNRYKLSRATAERFRDGGTFHALVISGMHITFIGALVFVVARWFTKNKLLQFLLSAAVLWSYALAVGAESSVARAAFMFTGIVLAPLVSRRAASLNVLGGTAIALLAWRPSDILDPSFQLTFVSVMALVIFAWPLLQRMSAIGSWRPTQQTPYPPTCAPWLRSFCEALFWSEREAKRELEHTNYSYKLFKTPLAGTLERFRVQRLLRYAFAAVVVSASVQLTLLPFLIVYFHRLSLASVVLNIGVTVLMASVAFFAAVALVISQLSATLAAPFISFTNGLNWLMVHSVDPFARVGVASVRIPEYTGVASLSYAVYYVPLALLAVSLWRWNPLQLRARTSARARSVNIVASLAQLIAIMLLVFHPGSGDSPTGKLRVDFLDVGQGDAALITFPDNTTLLVDGGGRPGPYQRDDDGETLERETMSIGEAVVSEYLWWRGLDHVDYLLATHTDSDHIDGLNDIARNFRVRAALVARTPQHDPAFATFAEALTNRRIPIQVIGAGDVLRFGEVTASVLWPTPLTSANAPSRNNDSIVLQIRFGERVFLLTGDIELATEEKLLAMNQDLGADVVKVAHHGSRTSSTLALVTATRPKFAVISVGQNSIFGHPHLSVVDRWKSVGSQILTTGNSGTITITTDGRELLVETFVK